MEKKKYIQFAIVNLITFSRVVGSIILPIIYFTHGIGSLACLVILLFLTDCVDGKLSRFWKVESFLGSLLDSISDKLFAFVMLSILSYEYHSMLIVLILEFIIFVINTLAFSENKNVKTSMLGKFKTFMLDVVVSLLFLYKAKDLYFSYLPVWVSNLLIRSEYATIYILIGVLIGMQLLTISNYSKKRIMQTTYEKIKNKKLKSVKEIWKMIINRDFYIKNKDVSNLKDFLYENE